MGVGTSEARRGLAAMGLRARSAPRASVQAQATQAKHRSSSSGLGQYFKRHHADQLPRSVAHNEARALHDHNDNVIVITSHRRTRYVLREGGGDTLAGPCASNRLLVHLLRSTSEAREAREAEAAASTIDHCESVI